MQQEETKDSNKGTFIVEPVVLEELKDEQIGDIDEWVHKSKNKEKAKAKKNEKNKA